MCRQQLSATVLVTLMIASLINSISTASAANEPASMPSVESLPAVADLPDPFVMKDGSRIKTLADWAARRAELLQLILAYEYGRPPADPAPGSVKADEESSKKLDGIAATEKSLILHMGPELRVSTHLILTIPDGPGPFPVIVKGDLCWKQVPAEIVGTVVRRGYILAEFDRTEVAPDVLNAPGGIRPLYPESDWGTIAAWAWGFSRVNDYLLTRSDVDPKRLIVTGHSRGGKAALLAGALDERVALTVPNGSGCGGAGCFREQRPDAEGIADILKHFPYWFSPQFSQFIGHVDRLPFDQHEVRALLPPERCWILKASATIGQTPSAPKSVIRPQERSIPFSAFQNASASTTAPANMSRTPWTGRHSWTLPTPSSLASPPPNPSMPCSSRTSRNASRGQLPHHRPRQNPDMHGLSNRQRIERRLPSRRKSLRYAAQLGVPAESGRHIATPKAADMVCCPGRFLWLFRAQLKTSGASEHVEV